MDKRQKQTLGVAVAVILVMGIFPPWRHVLQTGSVRRTSPAGYALLFAPPAKVDIAFEPSLVRIRGRGNSMTIHSLRRLLLWAVLSAATAVALWPWTPSEMRYRDAGTYRHARGSERARVRGAWRGWPCLLGRA